MTGFLPEEPLSIFYEMTGKTHLRRNVVEMIFVWENDQVYRPGPMTGSN